MSTDPMTEAVEAAARALYPGGHHMICASRTGYGPCDCYFRDYIAKAQDVLEAALPILRSQFAEEGAAAVHAIRLVAWMG